jgi:hypothetical protein
LLDSGANCESLATSGFQARSLALAMPRLDNVWFPSFVPEVPPDAFMFGRVAPAPAIFTFRFTRNQRLRKGVSSRASEAISLNWISFLGRHDALTPWFWIQTLFHK